MIRLGLLGKGIQHSKSQMIYEKILSKVILYKLIDKDSVDEIPELDIIFKEVDGLSITAPYKEFFLKEVELSPEASIVKAINCIKFDVHTKKYFGFNTDFLAAEKLIDVYQIRKHKKIVILGNGPMARIFIYLLQSSREKVIHIFRRPNFNINDFIFEDRSINEIAIINCCSRGVLFNPKEIASKTKTFWDLNYGQDNLFTTFFSPESYINGLDLLHLQAEFALDIWEIK